MIATFPSRRITVALVGVGAASSAALLAVFVAMFGTEVTGLAWSIPFLGSYLAGVLAFRARPDQVAARRLVLLGAASTLFISTSVGVALATDNVGHQWWLGPANVAIQLLGLTQGAAMVGLLAVYPDGTYHRRLERRVVLVLASLAVVVPLALLLTYADLQPAWSFLWGDPDDPAVFAFPDIASPLHLPALGLLGAPLRGYLYSGLLTGPLLGVVLVVLRYRRLPAARKRQVRWPAYGLLLVLVAPLAAILQEPAGLSPVVADALVITGLLALPTSALIGLVRPDLFDVDRAMRRSLVYAPLWIASAGAYVGVAAALGLAASSAGVQVAVGVTIVATVGFEPARRWLVRRAGRWAHGEQVGGEELLRRLGATLEHTLDIDRLSVAIAAVAREGLGAQWARVRGDGLVVTNGDASAAEDDAVLSAELVHGGERLGAIDVGPRLRGRVRDGDHALLDTLARQAALALHNARLASQLGERLDQINAQAAELTASRTRIVAAEEAARRRIERDLHDGAQQELVALIARIGLARNQHGNDSQQRLGTTLEHLQEEARHALDSLRQLASGVHPAVLSDHGLVEAIESRAGRVPIRVVVDCDAQTRRARYGDHVEGAAYFLVSEGIANALKHSDADAVNVRIRESAGQLEVEVCDQGRGFDVAETTRSGLRGLADRVEALGGSLAVHSAPGQGTRLSACLPTGLPAGLPTSQPASG